MDRYFYKRALLDMELLDPTLNSQCSLQKLETATIMAVLSQIPSCVPAIQLVVFMQLYWTILEY
jgi:hypothetical protein